MKTIKIIDLLNKIANGEEVPEKIRYGNVTYELNPITKRYIGEYMKNILIMETITIEELNDEVEIIEDTPQEDNKIDKLDLIFEDKFIKKRFKNGSISYLDTYATLKMIYEKQCEIIDKINGGE